MVTNKHVSLFMVVDIIMIPYSPPPNLIGRPVLDLTIGTVKWAIHTALFSQLFYF